MAPRITSRQRAAAQRNIKKAQAAARRRKAAGAVAGAGLAAAGWVGRTIPRVAAAAFTTKVGRDKLTAATIVDGTSTKRRVLKARLGLR